MAGHVLELNEWNDKGLITFVGKVWFIFFLKKDRIVRCMTMHLIQQNELTSGNVINPERFSVEAPIP